MQNVSEQFKQAVYAPVRQTTARVTFDISDVTIEDDIITTTTTPEFAVSDKEQLTDKVRENIYKFATWEPNRFKLDGSFSFPDDNMVINRDVGWVSQNLCDENGGFNPHEVLSFQFGFEHSSMGITITFDEEEGYATNFTVVGYADNEIVESVNVIGNKETQVTILGQFYLYNRIEIIIKKWSASHRRARVTEVDFGVVRVYKDDKLIKLDLMEEMDLTATTIPSSEFRFTIYNENREFNILNPEGIYKFLQERQQVTPEIGVVLDDGSVEYVELGKFYLMDWISDEGTLTASFTARNIIDLIATYDYENLIAKTNYSLFDMAEDILNHCEIYNTDFVTKFIIDEKLKDIPTKGLVNKTNCRSILQYIAIAGMCNVYVTKDDVIHVKSTYTKLGKSIDTVDMENQYNEPQISLDPTIKSVEVSYYTDLKNKADVVVTNADKGTTLKVDNPLINTEQHAVNVSNWIINQKKYRAKYTSNYRGNPTLGLNDIIVIEDGYGQNNKSILAKVELIYQGYLQGRIESRGLTE